MSRRADLRRDLPNHQTSIQRRPRFKLETARTPSSVARGGRQGRGSRRESRKIQPSTGTLSDRHRTSIAQWCGSPIDTTAYFHAAGTESAGRDSKMLSTYTGAAIYNEQESFTSGLREIDKTDKNKTPIQEECR